MTTTDPTNTTGRPVLSTDGAHVAEPVHKETPRHIAYRYTLAVTRLSLGWVFLWAFLDKTFGLVTRPLPALRGSMEAARRKASSLTRPRAPSLASTTTSQAPRGRTGCSWSAWPASVSR